MDSTEYTTMLQSNSLHNTMELNGLPNKVITIKHTSGKAMDQFQRTNTNFIKQPVISGPLLSGIFSSKIISSESFQVSMQKLTKKLSCKSLTEQRIVFSNLRRTNENLPIVQTSLLLIVLYRLCYYISFVLLWRYSCVQLKITLSIMCFSVCIHETSK